MINIHDLCKTYHSGRIDVLKGIDLTVNKGDFCAVMGPSGSGKSTLLNIIGLLDVPSVGSYLFNNRNTCYLTDKDKADIRRKDIGFVFQSWGLLPKYTARENVALPMKYSKMSRKEIIARADMLLEKAGLANRRDHLPSEMSGGQCQRVAIARALANNPSLLLADEPTGSLDEKTGIDIMETFKELNKAGMTIILITHDNKVAGYADRKFKIRNGVLKAV